jgi:hypothetical protein
MPPNHAMQLTGPGCPVGCSPQIRRAAGGQPEPVADLVFVRPTARRVKATRLVPLFVSLLSCSSGVAEYEPIDVSRVRDKVSTQLHQNFAIVFDRRGNRLVNPSRINTARKKPVIMGEFLEHKA